MASTTASSQGDHDTPRPNRTRSADELLVGRDATITPELSVVMPTLNEEAGIRTCIDWIKNAIKELQVPTEIIISDSSTDRTPEIAREMGAIVVEPDGKGYGYAYRYAFEQTRGDYIAMGDADTTYDFKQIPRLLDHLDETGADMVMGSRLAGEIEDGAMPPLHQHIGNPALTRFLNLFYGAGVSDAHSGFRIFTRDAYETMEWETTGMEFASEMIMEAGAKDLEIAEVPIVYHEREGEETLESFRDGWRHVRFMLVNAPGYLFSVPGLLLTIFGVAVMTVAHTGVALGEVTLGINSLIAGSLATIVGTQVGSLGVFATVASDPIQQPDDPLTTGITEYATLERGATAGVVVLAAGGAYASWLVGNWVLSGFDAVPFTSAALVAFTAVVVGIQLVFSSFFLSTVN
ncbi:glycosyltransferase family 2 protein [Halorubrum sp. Atlit-28R]|uniref:glycosyltransferase family 2 protein n=1 Tax=Halorubrum sp. Atlit-28R TaxID=2282129 RepID=UPI000EF20491|nr:glycosyltransferase family 2 protein [Halorubrum sp. Atlit-28R]